MQGESIRHRFGGLVRAGPRPQNRVSSATRFVGWRGNSLRPFPSSACTTASLDCGQTGSDNRREPR